MNLTLVEGKKPNLFYGRTDSKKQSAGQAFFFLPKLPKKSVIFSCLLRSKFSTQIFQCQKMADFTIFGSKKNKTIEQMVGRARKTGFSFFLALC